MLPQLKETQSLGRRAVSTPCGLGTSHTAPVGAATQALKWPRNSPTSAAQARPRRRPKPGPGPEPNSDPNLGSGQRASADWLALARLRPLMSTVLQSIQLRSCTMPTRSEEGSAWVPAHNRARFASEKKSRVSETRSTSKFIEINHCGATHTPPLVPPARALATPLTSSLPHLPSPPA